MGWLQGIQTMGLAISVCVLAGYAILQLTPLGNLTRRWFTNMPLGLRQHRRKKHAVLDVSQFESVEQYIASLSRSPRRSMRLARSLDPALWLEVFRSTNASVKPLRSCLVQNTFCIVPTQVTRPWDIGSEHLAVAIDHELRAMSSQVGAVVAGTFRVLVACMMLGEVVEYRETTNGSLVAWSVTICKGNTVRGQWFYQRTEWSRRMIWFHSVMQSIELVMIARTRGSTLRWVDVGPSGSSGVEDMKRKLGFAITEHWQGEGWCDYSGDYGSLYDDTPSRKRD